MPFLFKRDSKGIGQFLNNSTVAAAMHGYAERVAANLESTYADADVVVDDYVTDRAASSVTLKKGSGDPGNLLQVRDGALTKAVESAGLTMNEKR